MVNYTNDSGVSDDLIIVDVDRNLLLREPPAVDFFDLLDRFFGCPVEKRVLFKRYYKYSSEGKL